MTEKYDIQTLFEGAFNTRALPFPGASGKSVEEEDRVKAVKGNFNWEGMLGNEFYMPCKIDDVQLPTEPLIRITGGKRIIKTPVNRNNTRGTVKEEWNMKDYKIQIRGVAVNEEANDFPKDQLRKLRQILEKKGAVSISCEFTNLFNINQIAITDWDFPEDRGFQDMQTYVITGLSDEDFELQLIDENE
jgi:hypothetical protein